eukprot:1149585-Pelagomonas_calceolata.AAC.2
MANFESKYASLFSGPLLSLSSASSQTVQYLSSTHNVQVVPTNGPPLPVSFQLFIPCTSTLAFPEHTRLSFISHASSFSEKNGMWRCCVWLRGFFAPTLAEEGGFTNLHQMTSAPGLKLLAT